jgi:hypothetical protein
MKGRDAFRAGPATTEAAAIDALKCEVGTLKKQFEKELALVGGESDDTNYDSSSTENED